MTPLFGRRPLIWLEPLDDVDGNPDLLGDFAPTVGCSECGAAYVELVAFGVESPVCATGVKTSPFGLTTGVEDPLGVRSVRLECASGCVTEYRIPTYGALMLSTIGLAGLAAAALVWMAVPKKR